MNSKINTIPIDLHLRNKVMQMHNLNWIELIRLEAMSNYDLNGLGALREWLQDGFQVQTSSLLDRGFLSWDENARLSLSSKSVKIVSITNQPICIN
jgi:hypothetical protein